MFATELLDSQLREETIVSRSRSEKLPAGNGNRQRFQKTSDDGIECDEELRSGKKCPAQT
jgi:hypothetical protein